MWKGNQKNREGSGEETLIEFSCQLGGRFPVVKAQLSPKRAGRRGVGGGWGRGGDTGERADQARHRSEGNRLSNRPVPAFLAAFLYAWTVLLSPWLPFLPPFFLPLSGEGGGPVFNDPFASLCSASGRNDGGFRQSG